MKVKVTRKFRDKYTGERYSKGAVLDITEERYEEIISVGVFVQRIAQDAQNDTETNADTDVRNVSDEEEESAETHEETPTDGFDIMSVRELKEYADKAHKMTFKAGTKKAEIIEALRRMEHGRV